MFCRLENVQHETRWCEPDFLRVLHMSSKATTKQNYNTFHWREQIVFKNKRHPLRSQVYKFLPLFAFLPFTSPQASKNGKNLLLQVYCSNTNFFCILTYLAVRKLIRRFFDTRVV